MRSNRNKVFLVFAIAAAIAVAPGARCAFAQADESFSDHLNRLATPLPAAYHSSTQRLFVGLEGEVFAESVRAEPRIERVYSSANRNTVLRLRVDERRNRLWILETGRVHVIDLADMRRAGTVALTQWFYASEATNCLPDLQLDRDGAAIVSDSVQAKLWRIDPRNFAVDQRTVTFASHNAVDAGFSAMSIGADGRLFAAIGASGSLWRIDRARYRADRIVLDRAIYGACALEHVSVPRADRATLLLLAAGRESFSVMRIDMPRTGRAPVRAVAPGVVSMPAGLIASGGAVQLATLRAVRDSAQARAQMRLVLSALTGGTDAAR